MRALLPLLLLAACDPGTTPETGDTGSACAPGADPESVLWDGALLASANTLDVAVTNTCAEDVTLEMSTEGDEAFSVPRDTLPLRAGETTPIQVSFESEDLDAHSGELVLATPGGETRVTLQGHNTSDWDGDGHHVELAGGDDCDDSDENVYPGAIEFPCDGVDSDCDGAKDVVAVGSVEYATLGEAADASNGQSLFVCTGTHPTQVEVVSMDLTLLPWDEDAEPPVLDGQGTHRLFDVNGGSVDIRYMVLQNGSATGEGGAIRVRGGLLTLDEVTLTGHTATGDGGAIYVEAGRNPVRITDSHFQGNTSATSGGALAITGAGEVLIREVSFTENTATSADGGALFVEGVEGSPGQLDLEQGSFDYNVAGGEGGAVCLGQAGSVELSALETTFTNNAAGLGGGALGVSTDSASDVELDTCSFNSNSADRGGAVYYRGEHQRGDLAVDACQFAGNTATTQGGAFDVWSAGLLSFDVSGNSSISTGSAPTGGAVYLDGSTLWSPLFEDVNITNNTADAAAAMHLDNVSLMIRSSRVESNTAAGHAAAWVGTSATLSSRITGWGSTAGDNEEYDVMCAGGSAYGDYGGGANFTCTASGCN